MTDTRRDVFRRGRTVALIALLIVLGVVVGNRLSGGNETEHADVASLPESTETTEPAAPPTEAVPAPPPSEAPQFQDQEESLIPVRLALTSYTHRQGVAEGSVLRACGVTDLPVGARLGYEIVPTNHGDSGWVRERQPPHLYEGLVTLGASQDDLGLRTFCFETDVYVSCGMEPFHPLNCPLHVTVWFASSISGRSFDRTQPDNILEQFGVLGERLSASEHCDLGASCARVRPTNPLRVEYAERIFDSCPWYTAGCLPRN